ncbi:hypothetical protein GCM10009860_18670 [Microbacterium mitrae]
MNIRRGLMSIAAAMAVLSLAACAPTSAPKPSGSASPTASPTAIAASPRPAATPEPTQAEQVQAFGGDCAKVFSDGELSDTFGTSMTDLGVNWSVGQEESLGGLRCTWWSEGIYLGAVLTVTVLPAELAPAEVNGVPHCYVDGGGCSVTAVTSHGWYTVSIFGSLAGEDQALVNDLLQMVAERGDALPAASVPERSAAAWGTPTPTCAELASMLIAPDGAAVTGIDYAFDEASPLTSLFDVLGRWCTLATIAKDEQGTLVPVEFSVMLVPGGAVVYDESAAKAGGTPLEISNGRAVSVVVPFVAEGNGGVFATDETNTLLVSVSNGFIPSDFAWVADQLLGALAR